MAFPATEGGKLDFGMGTVPHGMKVRNGICINGMEICTYDESHVIAGGKYAAHIAECRKRQEGRYWDDGEEMLICPYDPTHHVHHSVMQKHIVLCEGFYRHCMDMQPDLPPDGDEEEETKTVVAEESSDNYNDNDSDWGQNEDYEEQDDDDDLVNGVTITDCNGIPQQPKTKGECRALLDEIAQREIQKMLDVDKNTVNPASDLVDLPVKCSKAHTLAKLTTEYEAAMLKLKKYNEQFL